MHDGVRAPRRIAAALDGPDPRLDAIRKRSRGATRRDGHQDVISNLLSDIAPVAMLEEWRSGGGGLGIGDRMGLAFAVEPHNFDGARPLGLIPELDVYEAGVVESRDHV
jgi:hypothetical protein